tara:strand:- start:120 stop:512 length:393 start_codon:yes stop_codon:yes gene_type:complete
MSEEEIDYSDVGSDSGNDSDDSPDLGSNIDDSEFILNNIEDSNVFRKVYENLKKTNTTSIYLNKYEITKILSKRCEQLENGSTPLISNYEIYNNVYDIALKELNEKKIPFILKRLINNKYEYFKLEDLNL